MPAPDSATSAVPDGDTLTQGGLPSSTTGQEHPGETRSLPPRNVFLALFSAVMLPMFLAAVDQTLLATATPRIAADFGGLGDTSWIAVGYLMAATVMAPLYGRLGDRYGRRRALLGALGVFALGSSLCAWAPGMTPLIAGRVVQGMGGGGLMVLSQALIGELVAPRDRPRYQGYFAVVFTASSVGGPVLGGVVVHHASWRWLFLANLPLCLFAAWRVWRLPQPPGRAPGRDAPIDPWGLLLFVVTACAALLWLGFVGQRFALVSAVGAGLLAVAATGATLLWHQQRRHPNPFLPLDLMRLDGVPWICASVVGFAAAMFALVFLLPIYLQLGHGADPSTAGLQMLPLTAGIVLGSWINGRITARSGVTGTLPRWGLGAAALALLALALLPPSLPLTLAAAGVCGLGFGTVMPNAQLATQVLAGRARLGAAAALQSVTRSLGASFGTAAFGALAFALLGVAPRGEGAVAPGALPAALDPARLSHAFHLVFGVLAVYLALAAWAATRLPRVRLDDGHRESAPRDAGGLR